MRYNVPTDMDYLDPKKKRSHQKRLLLGYALTGIAIGLATLILVFIGNGYFIGKDGELIRNGLLYIDARPESALIFLNGEKQNTGTDARMVLPAGKYNIELQRRGYRNWRQKIEVEEASVRRLTYPWLIPETFKTENVQTFATQPPLVSQSDDRKALVTNTPDKPLSLQFMNTATLAQAPTQTEIPSNLFPPNTPDGELKAIEWSENNRHILFSYKSADKLWFIVFDREQPAASVNINTTLNVNPTEVFMRNRKADQIYVYEKATTLLRSADLGSKTFTKTVSNEVAQFKAYGDNVVLYVSTIESAPGKAPAVLIENDKPYKIRDLTKSDSYLIDIAKLGNSWVVMAGSPKENKVFVYSNPTNYLRNNPKQKTALARAVLAVNDPRFVSFSADSTIASMYSGKNFAVYDFENDEKTNFSLPFETDPAQKQRWIDGHHLSLNDKGNSYILDYDGSNLQKLVSSLAKTGVYFDQDYENLISFTTGKESKPFFITRSPMKVAPN